MAHRVYATLNLLTYTGGLNSLRKIYAFMCPFILGKGDNVHIVRNYFFVAASAAKTGKKENLAIY